MATRKQTDAVRAALSLALASGAPSAAACDAAQECRGAAAAALALLAGDAPHPSAVRSAAGAALAAVDQAVAHLAAAPGYDVHTYCDRCPAGLALALSAAALALALADLAPGQRAARKRPRDPPEARGGALSRRTLAALDVAVIATRPGSAVAAALHACLAAHGPAARAAEDGTGAPFPAAPAPSAGIATVEASAMVRPPGKAPVLVSGLTAGWPALDAARPDRRWGPAFASLRRRVGHRVVPVEAVAPGERQRQRFVTVDDLVDSFKGSADGGVLYMAQHRLFDHMGAALDGDVVPPPPHFFAEPGASAPRLIVAAWIGPEDTRTPPHHDPFDNYLCQVVGDKVVALWPPSAPPPPGSTCGPPPNASDAVPGSWDGPWPRVVTLRPGGALFIPSGWWHAVTSTSAAASVSFWG